MEIKPEAVIYSAVRGMLPKNKLTDRYMSNLKVYAGPEHPHVAQNPKPLME
jgi:large subunit ribosomal protein L13